jgi:hypothetical protein
MVLAATRDTAVGEMIRRHLTTLGQRRGGEQDPKDSSSPAFGCPSPRARSACLLTARLIPRQSWRPVVPGPFALPKPWPPVVDLDVQRLADKIISRCYVPADHRDNHAVFTCDPALLERAAGGGLIAFVGCQLRRLFSRAAGLATRVKLGALLGVAATMINWTALWRAFMISCRTAMLWGNGDEASSQPVFFVVGPCRRAPAACCGRRCEGP